MSSMQLPSTRYGEETLRLVLVPEDDENRKSIPSLSIPDQDPNFDDLPTLTSARYGDPSPTPSPVSHHRRNSPSRDRSRESRRRLSDSRSNSPLDKPDSDVDADEDDDEDDDDADSGHSIPVHPIPSLQDAFAESLLEVTGGAAVAKPKLRLLDGPARREALLAQGKDEAPLDASWRLRPGQSQHEVSKLISQIAFGVYLLLDGNANSNVQVVDILQGHIDEVDEFLEVILEDVVQAEKDIAGRIEELSLPMADMASFEKMLEDRKYRAELIDGNQVIEHALARTNAVMRLWEDDIDAGLQASNAFIEWLGDHTDGRWRLEQPQLLEIFDAMNGNAEGWLLAFERMSDSAQDLTGQILRLMNTMADVEKKAGEVSRKNWSNIAPFSTPGGAIARMNSGSSTNASSFRSFPRRSIARISLGSGSITRARPPSSIISDMSDESDDMDFPLAQRGSLTLPGLRPPPANPGLSHEDDGFRLSPVTYSPMSTQKSSPGPSVTPQIHEDEEAGEECQATESPVFILQPRTYTPQPPAPLPSPRVKEYGKEPVMHFEREHNRDHSARATPSTFQSHAYSDSRSSTQSTFSVNGRVQTWQSSVPSVQKRTSLRQRVSLKASPPGDIRIPPRSLEGMEVYAHSSNNSTPRSTPSTNHGSEDYRRQHVPASASQRSCESPGFYSTASSPQRENRHFRPVMASPHSPLQQRPHTAVGTGQPAYQQQPMLVPPPLLRNRPSQMSGMSVTSNGTSRSFESRGPSTRSVKSENKLKKKKSAFGWLKKAFSMDEEERAAYEARKAMQGQERYYPQYEANGPSANKFIDGRRVRR